METSTRDSVDEGPCTDAELAEEVVLLSPDGRAVGTAVKAGVHHADTPLHLAFSCYLVDASGRVLVTRRAWHKATFPGVETNSVCGHPAPGESFTSAVRRRAHRELGLTVDRVQPVIPGFAYRAEQDGVVEHEICPVFVAHVEGDHQARFDPDEVDEAWWVAWPQWRDEVLGGRSGISPWCRTQVSTLRLFPDDPRAWPAADVAALPPAAPF